MITITFKNNEGQYNNVKNYDNWALDNKFLAITFNNHENISIVQKIDIDNIHIKKELI